MMAATTKLVQCVLQVNTGSWRQESHESASGDARRRASELRKLGYVVTVSPLGPQITPLGSTRTTLVDIRPGSHRETFGLPAVDRVDWPQ
jgi:hypothetical protein